MRKLRVREMNRLAHWTHGYYVAQPGMRAKCSLVAKLVFLAAVLWLERRKDT